MTNNKSERAREMVQRARASERKGEAAKALGLYDDALAMFEGDSPDPFLADVLRWKGTLLRERGETEAAYRNYTQSLSHARRCRSEEHTSELQSRLHLVCRLLLEKK